MSTGQTKENVLRIFLQSDGYVIDFSLQALFWKVTAPTVNVLQQAVEAVSVVNVPDASVLPTNLLLT